MMVTLIRVGYNVIYQRYIIYGVSEHSVNCACIYLTTQMENTRITILTVIHLFQLNYGKFLRMRMRQEEILSLSSGFEMFFPSFVFFFCRMKRMRGDSLLEASCTNGFYMTDDLLSKLELADKTDWNFNHLNEK